MLSSALFWVMLLVTAAIPYGMYLVAYVFEGRRPGNGPRDVPVLKGQSKAFLPGDFGLALCLTVAIYYSNTVAGKWSYSLWYSVVCAILGLVVFNVARSRFYTAKDYSRAAWKSPSKRYHDYILYGWFTMLMARYCVPVYFTTVWTEGVLNKLLGVFGFCLWVVGMYYDFKYPQSIDKKRQYPNERRSIIRQSTRV